MNMTINRLPVPTWNHLKMNQADLSGITSVKEGNLTVVKPENVAEMKASKPVYLDLATGSGRDVDKLIHDAEVPCHRYSVKKGERTAEPVRLSFRYEKDSQDMSSVELTAEDNGYLWVIEDFSGMDASGFAGIQTKIRAGRGAVVRLVQIHKLGDDLTFLNDVGGTFDESAKFELIQIVLAGGKIYLGAQADLNGKAAELELDSAYMVEKDHLLDINYAVNHIGRKTVSNINANGTIADTAKKIFRGTIDLRNGAVGAKGNEMENILLMSDNIVNQTIPLILCDEEDVEGNHGASIGKLDEELLFYMESRGLSTEEIYRMMSTAHVEALLKKVNDEMTKCDVHGFLKGAVEEE